MSIENMICKGFVISEYKCMKYKGKILLKATLKLNGNLADQNLAINLH